MAGEHWKEILRPYYLRWFYFPIWGGRPDYFQKPWRHPTFAFTEESIRNAIPRGDSSPSFIFFPMSDWHTRMQRPQHLATALAGSGHTCYFLNPHLGRQFSQPYPFSPQSRLVSLGRFLLELHVRLPAEPVYHHRLLTRRETVLLADQLSRLAGIRGDKLVQVVAFPSWMETALELRRRHGWPILYDCHDYLAGFSAVAPVIVAAEEPLMAQADHVLFSSLWLQDHIRLQVPLSAGRYSIVRNAVTQQLLSNTRVTPKQGTRRTVGYFGALDSWFDVESVRAAAERHEDIHFQLVGRVEHPAVLELKSVPNVQFLGEVPYDELPALLAGFDVGLIPFEVNDLTRAANPIKLYEYFSAGIPVVSSRLPEVEQFGNLVYIADNPNHFAECVGAALAEADDIKRVQRRTAVQQETWNSRAICLLEIGRELLTPP